MKKNNLLNTLAKPYKTKNYLSLILTPYGTSTLNSLKRYCMGAIFTYFDNPIYIDSPQIQDNLTISKETIKLTNLESLRHTFHHFYFKMLKDKNIPGYNFPLEYIEQGLLFREESGKDLKPFSRQSSFSVTNLHSFCIDKTQCLEEIKSVFTCIKRFEEDWEIKFDITCHIKDENMISVEEVENLWGSDFEKNLMSEEDAFIALDFNISLPGGETIELTSLELYSVEIGNRRCLLVDFTIGGAERILSTIYLKNSSVPFWLAPVHVIALTKDIKNEKTIEVDPNLRIMVVNNMEQLQKYKEMLQIPEVYENSTVWIKYLEKHRSRFPNPINIPLHKNVILKDNRAVNYDIL